MEKTVIENSTYESPSALGELSSDDAELALCAGEEELDIRKLVDNGSDATFVRTYLKVANVVVVALHHPDSRFSYIQLIDKVVICERAILDTDRVGARDQ